MPNTKTSQEAPATALQGPEMIRGVQNGTNVRIAMTQIRDYLVGALEFTIGVTSINSGTPTRILFDDAGKVGEDVGLTYTKSTGTFNATVIEQNGVPLGALAFQNTAGISQLTGDVTAGPGSGSQAATLTTAQPGAHTWNATQTFTPAANTQAITVTGASLTASGSMVSVAGTWNNGAVAFPGALLVNVTNTASAAGSLLADFQVGGTSQFNIGKLGTANLGINGVGSGNTATLTVGPFTAGVGGGSIQVAGSGTGNNASSILALNSSNAPLAGIGVNYNNTGISTAGGALMLGSVGVVVWGTGQILAATFDTALSRFGAGTLGLSNGSTTATTLQIYKTTDSATAPTNYSRLVVDAGVLNTNYASIFTKAGGTGVQLDIEIGPGCDGSAGGLLTLHHSGAQDGQGCISVVGTGAANWWGWNTSGHFIAEAGNTYDIGASGSNQPRNIYVGTNIVMDNSNAGIFASTNGGNFFIGSSALANNIFIRGSQIQFGTTDAAAPAAQILQAQSVVAGTSNTAGQDWTRRGSLSTGTAVQGNYVYTTGFTGTTQTAAAVTVTSASPAVVSLASHGFAPGQVVQFAGSPLPTGISAATNYYVSPTAIAAGSFQISSTWPSLTPVNTSSTGTSVTVTSQASAQNSASTILTIGPSTITGSLTTAGVLINQTWQTSGIAAGVLVVNALNVQSAAGSKVADFQVAGTSKFKVIGGNGYIDVGNTAAGFSNSGILAMGMSLGTSAGNTGTVAGEQIGLYASGSKVGQFIFGGQYNYCSTSSINWSNSASNVTTMDVSLSRFGVGIFGLSSGTNISEFNQYATTDSVTAPTNYARVASRFTNNGSAADTWQLAAEKGGSGTAPTKFQFSLGGVANSNAYFDFGIFASGCWHFNGPSNGGSSSFRFYENGSAVWSGTLNFFNIGSQLTMSTSGPVAPNTYITCTAAATVQFGNTDAASPIAQTTQVQSVVAGTTSVAGVNWTQQGSLSTGVAVQGNQIFANGFTGVAQNAAAVTVTSASPAVISLASHGFVPGQVIRFAGSPLPTGISGGTTNYFVSPTSLAAGTFQISSTWPALTPVNTSSTGTSVTITSQAAQQNPASTVLTIGPSGLTGSLTSAAVTINQTWNTSGIADAALLVNVTNINSGSGSYLADLQVNGTSAYNFMAPSSGHVGSQLQLIFGNILGSSAQFTGQSGNNFAIGIGTAFSSPTGWAGANAGLVVANGTNGFHVSNGTNFFKFDPSNQAVGFGVFSNSINSDVILSRAAAASLQHGAADAASDAPVAQTLRVQSSSSGTTTTPKNFTIIGMLAFGAAQSGDIIFQTGKFSSNQAAATTALTIKGETQNILFGSTMTYTGGGGLQLGSPTGGDKGSGNINVAAGIFLNNTSYTNPDYVLEKFYTGKIERYADKPRAKIYGGLMDIPMLADHMREHCRLPGISDEPTDIFERADIALEKLEEQALYIIQLHDRIAVLESERGLYHGRSHH